MSGDLSLRFISGQLAGTDHPVGEVEMLGRSDGTLVVPDKGVSRNHARLARTEHGLTIEDVGSSNGTFVNGHRITGATLLSFNDRVHLGSDVEFVIIGTPHAPVESPAVPVAAVVVVAPMTSDQDRVEDDGIEVRYIKASAGRRTAKSMLDSARKARRRLAGFGNEPTAGPIVIHLVDPYVVDGNLFTSGSVIDVPSRQIWCIVSSESRPEDPTRALALLFGTNVRHADTLSSHIAGYGMALAGFVDAAPQPIGELAEPERTRTAAAFVAHLVERTNDESVRAFLSTSEGIDETAQELFGASLAELEAKWITADTSEYKSGQFARLAFRRIWPYRLRQAEVFVYMVLSLAFTSVYPFVTRNLFDEVIPSGEFSRVVSLLGWLVLAFAISLVAGVRRGYQSSFIAASVVRDLRQEMFDHVQRLSASSIGRYQQGELLSRMFSDIGRLQVGLSAMINTGIFQFITLLVTGTIMLSVNWKLGLLVIAGAPVIAFVYRRMGEGAQQRSTKVQEDNAALFSIAAENNRAGPVVKLFQLEGHEQSRFGQACSELIKSTQRMALFNGFFGLSVNVVVTLLQVTTLALGAWLIFQGQFTLGGLVAFLGVMSEFLSPVTSLTTLGQTMQQSLGSLKRVEEITRAETEPAGEALPAMGTVQHSIELRNLSFSYSPERRTLDGVNVTIPAGSKVAFVGPSGSGKSTVLQMIMRLLEPDEGGLFIDGVDVRERSMSSLRRQMGVVFQDPFLFDLTLAQNIALGGDNPTEHDIVGAAEAAEITTFLERLPAGLDSPVGEDGSQLSGGQRQRVAIARALVSNPAILVLDEATSALDPATERQINDTIDRAVTGRTVVTVTHRLTSITEYDQIVVLVDGRIESVGTHDALLAERGTYARLWAEQTGAAMPEPAEFDLVGVLAELPPLRQIPREQLAVIAATAQTYRLDTGRTMPEPEHAITVVKQGRGQIVFDTGERADVTVGGVFGLNGLLGQGDESLLVATEPMIVMFVDEQALREVLGGAVVASSPSVELPATSMPLVRATYGARPTMVLAAATKDTIVLPVAAAEDIGSTVRLQRVRPETDQ